MKRGDVRTVSTNHVSCRTAITAIVAGKKIRQQAMVSLRIHVTSPASARKNALISVFSIAIQERVRRAKLLLLSSAHVARRKLGSSVALISAVKKPVGDSSLVAIMTARTSVILVIANRARKSIFLSVSAEEWKKKSRVELNMTGIVDRNARI